MHVQAGLRALQKALRSVKSVTLQRKARHHLLLRSGVAEYQSTGGAPRKSLWRLPLCPWRNPEREPPAKAGARIEGFDGAADCVKTYGTSFDKLRTSG